MPVGNAVVEFSKSRDANIFVAGQSSIQASSKVEAWIMGASTGDHSHDEHIMAAALMDIVTSAPVVDAIDPANSGFTIYALVRDGTLNGQFEVQWVWS